MCHRHAHPAGESVFTSGPDIEMHAFRRLAVSGLSGLTEKDDNCKPDPPKMA
jgi:hypothetical protein